MILQKNRCPIPLSLEQKKLRLAQDERDFARQCPSPFEKVPFTQEALTFDDSDNKVQQAAMLENFAGAVAGTQPLACPFAQGVHSLEIIQGAYLSSWTQKTCALPPDQDDFDRCFRQKG